MNRTIEINGETFKVFKAGYTRKRFECGGRDLYDLYKNPSSAKRSVWIFWKNWVYDHNLRYTPARISHFGADNGNSQTFTISGIYKGADGKEYGLHITANNNYAYELND